MRNLKLILLGCALVQISACRFFTTLSEPATRSASPFGADKTECALALSSGTVCRMSIQSCTRAVEVMKDIQARPANQRRDILTDEFVQKTSQSKDKIEENCIIELEHWALESIAGGKKAPYNVAGLVIPGLQEIKLLIWGGGMAAGFLGDGVGSACMSAIGSGISYAESKKWIQCK
ncbi:MAG: hypothetical protein RI953_2673 [Pseudomonadota bacterium]|jgi:hypothetical protein